ncbi:MAG TPA: chromosome segregation protein SMC [Gemmatimonadota bacterium]|nr:chromosome segregation protein SMC [Gemmatimonadota bacterium]
MKLQRLEMFGFKSFADRVAIDFNPGITAIVGPNGCGKSNISDAIRWVLGEQRPTLVRGSKMEEVIFAGSRDRKPINLAEVVLRFSNEDGTLPLEYSEVAIARRVFREGVSEYILNKHVCRLKDIQDLFMGTGVGTHTYSLIQQGMVDSILSDKAEERRVMFEEAAGVTRYKSRRKATERKLEATTADLLRVEDIVGEVEKNVVSLRRQVGKARRWREYADEEARLDVHVTGAELVAIGGREGPVTTELAELQRVEAEQAARLGDREAALETLELEIVEARRREEAVREQVDALKRRISRREDSQLVTGETLRHNAERLEALGVEDARAASRADDLEERRANLEVDRHAAQERVDGVLGRLRSEAEGSDEAHQAELRAERGGLAGEIDRLLDQLGEARQAAARQGSAAEGAAERIAVLEAELEARRTEAAGAEGARNTARSGMDAAEEQRREQGVRIESLAAVVRTGAEELEAARGALAAARAGEHSAAGRFETLEAMEARFEGYGRGARALLAEGGGRHGLAGALPQSVESTDPAFEVALDRYLESLGHAIVAADRAAAGRGADRLAAGHLGRADFVVPALVAVGPPPEIPDAAAAHVVARGDRALRWTGEPALGAALEPLFARLLVVADRDRALACRAALDSWPEAARHYVIAGMDGTLIEPTGRWRTAGEEGDGGLVARRRLLLEARAELENRRAVAADAVRKVSALEDALARSERELSDAQAALLAAEDRYRESREAAVVAEQEERQAARRVAELERQTAEQNEMRERASAAVGAIADTIEELEADLGRARARLDDVRAALQRHDEVRAERLSARHAVELERAEAEAALRAIERELEHLASEEDRLAVARAERAAERRRLDESSAALGEEREATLTEIESLYAELDGIEKSRVESGEALRDAETRRSAFETEVRELRRAHDGAIERRHELELARQDLQFRRQVLLDHVAESYGKSLEELGPLHPLTETEAVLPLDDLRGRLEEVRRKRANLGPVNMLAVEEYEREAERFEFLARQRDDLVKAKRQLEEAIRTINATARQLFVETFEAVRQNLDITFKTLFEGGHAEIRLENPDDPLESPIEIVASPRGKRVQHISLLSGGERALTALSLLFAIYLVKPSPFCILDEVDAPLDDANVSRFLKMIRHFSAETQFVVITHNKRTMAEADYLYGITMEEPGVSTLVSVSLDSPVERERQPEGGRRPEEEAEVALATSA